MKKGCFIHIFLIILIIGIIGSFIIGFIINNKITLLNEEVNTTWTKLESSYQERINLLPRFTEIINQSTSKAQKEVNKVNETKTDIIKIQIDPSNLSTNNIEKFGKQQDILTNELNKLYISINNSSELKNKSILLEIKTKLENIQKTITKNKDNYNKSVANYNNYIEKYPNKIIADFRNYKIKGAL